MYQIGHNDSISSFCPKETQATSIPNYQQRDLATFMSVSKVSEQAPLWMDASPRLCCTRIWCNKTRENNAVVHATPRNPCNIQSFPPTKGNGILNFCSERIHTSTLLTWCFSASLSHMESEHRIGHNNSISSCYAKKPMQHPFQLTGTPIPLTSQGISHLEALFGWHL